MKVSLTRGSADVDVILSYKAKFEKNGFTFETPVCDFASAGNIISEEKELFSVFF